MNPSTHPSAVRSKNEITTALLELMKKHPYSEITVKEIILESQVARKTFYRNFSSKDDVLNTYIDSLIHDYSVSFQEVPGFKLESLLDVILNFCTNNKEFIILLRDHQLMYLFLQHWNHLIPIFHSQLIDPNDPFFSSFTEQELRYIIAVNIGAAWNVVMQWLENDMSDSTDEIKQTVIKYVGKLSGQS